MYRSEYLFHHIDELVADKDVFPVCIPSYNRPNASLLKYVDNFPAVLFIRREQEELYNQYKGRCKIVLIDNVYDIGTTRKAIVDWAIKNEVDNIFMLDDDITFANFMMPSKSSKSDNVFMRAYCTIHSLPYVVDLTFFKMWVYLLSQCDEKVTLSGAGAKSDWWDLGHADTDYYYNSCSIIQCVHLNVKNLRENNINYDTNQHDGAEDYALQYKIMREGLYTVLFKDLMYNVAEVNNKKGGNHVDDIKLKYYHHIYNFMKYVLEPEDRWRTTTKVSKSGLPSVKFMWPKWKTTEFFRYNIDTINASLNK